MARKKKEEPRPTKLFAYVGVYPDRQADKLKHAYLEVEDAFARHEYPLDEQIGKLKIYTKRFGHVSPGAVIKIEHDDEGRHKNGEHAERHGRNAKRPASDEPDDAQEQEQ